MAGLLVVAPSLTALGGGVEQHARHLVTALTRLYPRAPIEVVLGREGSLSRPELLDEEVRARLKVRGAGDGKRLLRLARLASEATLATASGLPELIICQHLNYLTIGAMTAQLSGARLCAVAHGIEAWAQPSPARKIALDRCDRVIAVSRATAGRLERAAGLDGGRVRVVPNAVDLERFAPGPVPVWLEEKLPKRPRLLTVARLDAGEAYKGVDVVIEALAGIPVEERPSYVVVGNGDDRARLETLARARRVAVTFWGRADDDELPAMYRACDLFVMPSRGEGFGIVFLEALASGLPCIGGDDDGTRDALCDGALGLLVDAASPEAVRAAITTFLDGNAPAELRDPARLRQEVAARFSPAAVQRALSLALPALP